MELNFDNKEVKAFFKEVCKLGGNTKKIDTQVERDKLAEYLSGNSENMSENDIAILDSFIKESPKQKQVQKETAKDIELDVSTDDRSITQINIGNNNENNINLGFVPRNHGYGNTENAPVNNESKLVEKKTDKSTKKVNKPTEKKTDKPAEKKYDKLVEEKVNTFDKEKVDKPLEKEPNKLRIESEKSIKKTVSKGDRLPNKEEEEETDYKYNVTVNLMPGPGPAKDLNYIKKQVCLSLKNFPLEHINKIIEQVQACSSIEDIEECLNQYSIGLKFVY